MTHLLRLRLHGDCTGVAWVWCIWQASGGRLAHSAPSGQRPAGRVIESHTSLGYEPYDDCLSRLGLSLAGAVTSADRTDPISLRRLRLPCLELSRRVRFTNRFTEQAIDLRFTAPSWRLPSSDTAVTSRLAKRPRDLPGLDTADSRDAATARRTAILTSDSAASRLRPAGSVSNRGPEAAQKADPLLRRSGTTGPVSGRCGDSRRSG